MSDKQTIIDRRLLVLVEQSPFPIAMFDKEMCYLFASKKWLLDYRLNIEDIQGKNHYELFPEISEQWKEVHRRCLNGAIEKNEEEAIHRMDGTIDWIRWEVHPWYENLETIGGIVIFTENISSRKNNEESLKKAKEELTKKNEELDTKIQESIAAELNLSLALENGKMGSWWMDVLAMKTEISSSLAALYGTTETLWNTSEFIDKFIHPDDRAEIHLLVTKAHYCLKPLYHEFRIIRADGEIRWHYLRCSFSFDKEKDTIRLLGIQGDRTEGKINGDKLRESEERYRNLVADAQDGIVIIDGVGQIIFGNSQIEVMFGYCLNELINQPIELLMPSHLHISHVQHRDRFLANPTKRPMGRPGLELNGRRKDGSEFPVDIGLSPSQTTNGKIVTAIIRDMSIRKKKEEQVEFIATAGRVLAESFENDVDVLKKITELVVTRLAEGCAVRLLGEDKQLQLASIIHRDLNKQKILEESSSAIIEVLETKIVQINNDFSEFGEFNSAIIPMNSNGKMIGIISIISDKSKMKFEESDKEFLESIGTQIAVALENSRLYSKAQNAIKLREEILAIVSHDLKNPLNLIHMTGQILPRFANDKAKILNFSEKILRASSQMKRMIDDLMDFSKIQEGMLSIELKVEKPKQVLETVTEVMRPQADEKGVLLTMDVSPELPDIMFDNQRIAQALLNLLGNAIKFTETGGIVQISAVESLGAVKFSVSDTGPGILEEDLPKLFDRYWQAKRSNTASAGLGLSITKGIIEAHGSLIRVESQIGKGSTFYFTLPV